MKKRYIISGIFFLLFILITVLMITNNTKVFDDKIYNYIFSFRNDFSQTDQSLINNFKITNNVH